MLKSNKAKRIAVPFMVGLWQLLLRWRQQDFGLHPRGSPPSLPLDVERAERILLLVNMRQEFCDHAHSGQIA
jgi:hypothetical protein